MSLLLFNLSEISSSISTANTDGAYPVSLIKMQNTEWALVAEVATTRVLVIKGTSVENTSAEYFSLSASDSRTLKV